MVQNYAILIDMHENMNNKCEHQAIIIMILACKIIFYARGNNEVIRKRIWFANCSERA